MSGKIQKAELIELRCVNLGEGNEERFWVDKEGRLESYSPSEIIKAFEGGLFDADTPVRIKKDAPNKPLRSYLKELVWLSYQADASLESAPTPPSLFEVVFQNAPIGVVLGDLAGRIQYANEAFCQIVDYGHDDLLGKRVGEISDASTREDEQRLGNELLSGKRQSYQLEKKFIKKDGTRISTLLNVSMIRGENGKPERVAAHVVDLTSYNRLQQELSQAEHLQTLGRLSSAIAHDFNNLLAVVLGLISELRDDNETVRSEAIQQVTEAANAASRLTKRLLTFSNEGTSEATPVDVNKTLARLKPILRGGLGHNGTLVYDTAPEPVMLLIDPIQLEQLIMNLSFNAMKAMPDGGTLTIRTQIENDRVTLCIADTGRGMTKEVQARAFDPFFTTKKESGGTGLGLSTVSQIVNRFQGKISLQSHPGLGTRISTEWPRATGDEQSQQQKQKREERGLKQLRRGGRILVVDDQDTILRIVCQVLSHNGYDVVAANSVQDAMTKIKNAQESFQLLVCDIQLPDGDGGDVAEVFMERCSDAKILYMSGYAVDSFQNLTGINAAVDIMQKPFLPSYILERINDLMIRKPKPTN